MSPLVAMEPVDGVLWPTLITLGLLALIAAFLWVNRRDRE